MTTIAFIETETGWHPCLISEVKKGHTYYIVRDGVQEPLMLALADAVKSKPSIDDSWIIDSKLIE